jgi:hypothetical protein
VRITIAFLMLLGALSIPLLAGPPPAPEIDAGSAASAIGLIGGSVMLLRSRKKK